MNVNRLGWSLLAIIILNLAALDFIAYRIDSALLAEREAVCATQDRMREAESELTHPTESSDRRAAPSPYRGESSDGLLLLYDLSARQSGWSVMQFSHNNHAVVDFYGCDANGKRYRLWKHR